MAKYTAVAAQTVAAGQNVLLDTVNPCNRRHIFHTDGTGTLAVRGVTNQCFARYRVSFGANIAVPTGGTAGEISVALSVGGEPVGSATAIVTPAAVEEFFHVALDDLIDVPAGLALTVAVRNTSDQVVQREFDYHARSVKKGENHERYDEAEGNDLPRTGRVRRPGTVVYVGY